MAITGPAPIPTSNINPILPPPIKSPGAVNPTVASVPNTTPTPVPRSQIDQAPAPVIPGVATGTSVASTNSVPSLDIATAAANVTPAASATGNIIIPTVTKPGGNSGAIQFNSNSTFGGSANLTFAQNGLWVGGVSSSANASGIITTKNDFRAGTWSPIRSSAENPAFSRLRFVANAPNANTSFYGFNSDYQVIQQQCTVVTNENVTTSAAVLMEGVGYNHEYAPQQPGTIFGISINNGFGDPISTGREYGWQKLMVVDNWGGLSVGGNISIKPQFNTIWNHENPMDPGRFGIVFADGSYQWHAPIIQKDSTNVVANASIVNFVGSGVTVSNANGIANISIAPNYSNITVRDEGVAVVSANVINFVGAGVTASNVSGIATITIPGGGTSGITVQEEGSNVVATANTINFVGSGVTASNVSGVATITVSGSGIGGIAVQEEGSNVVATANTVNFVGAGVTASNVGGVATITVSGGGSGITVQEESSTVVATATTVNFLGAGVTASNIGGVAVVTVPGGVNTMYGGSPVTTSAQTINFVGPLANVTNVGLGTDTTDVVIGLTVQDESTVVTGNAAIGTLNFLGSGVTVTAGATGVANITINSGGSSGGLPGYLRTYTGGTDTPAVAGSVWYPLPLDNTAIINTINASDYPNGIVNLQAGTYTYETTAYIKNTGSDGINYVYTAIVENGPGTGVGNVIANGCRLYLGDWQTGTFVATGRFTIASQKTVSVAFLQSDPSPQAIAYAENGWCTTILKLWQTA